MPIALTFTPEQGAAVESGRKTAAVLVADASVKRGWGLMFYIGFGTSAERRIGPAVCTGAVPVVIGEGVTQMDVRLDGRRLSAGEAMDFASLLGYASVSELRDHFRTANGGESRRRTSPNMSDWKNESPTGLPFTGLAVQW